MVLLPAPFSLLWCECSADPHAWAIIGIGIHSGTSRGPPLRQAARITMPFVQGTSLSRCETVKEQRSALESWKYIEQSDSGHDQVNIYVPMILSIMGAVGVAPFAVLRYVNGEYLVAALDTVVVIGLLGLGYTVYHTRRIRLASLAISVFCAVGVVASVHAIGTKQLYWAYPAVMVAFYLMKPREAIVLVLALLILLAPELFRYGVALEPIVFLITTLVMSAFGYAFSSVTNSQQALLARMATKDPLTGAGNRRALETKLNGIVAANGNGARPSSLAILDLDHFKAVNDAHGHAVGDQILCSVAEIVNLRIRKTDSLYRIGGEEFVVVLEDRDIDQATRLAEQLRTLVEVNELVPDHSVTISLGVAELRGEESCGDWLARADEALYHAKEAGRNTIRCAV